MGSSGQGRATADRTDVADDTRRGPAPQENIEGGGEPGVVAGGKGDNILFGSACAEVLSGNDGNDLIVAAAGADVLIGDKGYDTLRGGGGDDSLIGDSGELSPENSDDELAGGEDTTTSSAARAMMFSSAARAMTGWWAAMETIRSRAVPAPTRSCAPSVLTY